MDLEKPVIPPPFSESESVTHQSKKDELLNNTSIFD